MREVVTTGTGKRAGAASVAMAGKTGTAELADAPSHAWFIGFAPYGAQPRKIAFSVLVENGVYGGTAAAPAAAEIVNAAAEVGTDPAMNLFSEIEKTIERGFRRFPSACSDPPIPTNCCWCIAPSWKRSAARCRPWRAASASFRIPHVTVTLISADADRRAVYQTAFGEDGRLEKDIRETLEGVGCQIPRGFAVEVNTAETGDRRLRDRLRSERKAEPRPAAESTPRANSPWSKARPRSPSTRSRNRAPTSAAWTSSPIPSSAWCAATTSCSKKATRPTPRSRASTPTSAWRRASIASATTSSEFGTQHLPRRPIDRSAGRQSARRETPPGRRDLPGACVPPF